jgi:hypothetical protein
VTLAWNEKTLIILSLTIPLIAGWTALSLSRRKNPYRGKEWVAGPLLPESTGLQGVVLDRSALGFSLSNATQDLFDHLSEGSRIGFHDRRTLIWSSPEGTRLSPPDLLKIFGVNWESEIDSRSPLRIQPLPEGALLWKLGSPLPKPIGKPDARDQKRLWSLMKQKVRGRGRPHRAPTIGFRPVFENGIWTGGYLWKKHGSKLK